MPIVNDVKSHSKCSLSVQNVIKIYVHSVFMLHVSAARGHLQNTFLKEHKATLDAHNKESGTPNGAQTAALQKTGRKHPMSSKLMITTTTCLKSTT
jgi:hypothetical protein